MKQRKLHLLTALAVSFLALTTVGCAGNGDDSSPSSSSSSSPSVSTPVSSETPDSSSSETPASSSSSELPDSSSSSELPPDSSSSSELPDSSSSSELPDSSSSSELPDSSSSSELPPDSSSSETPDSSSSEEIPDSSSSEEEPDSSTSSEEPDSSSSSSSDTSSSSSEGEDPDEPSEDPHPDTVHEETAPSDLNIYLRADNFDLSYMWAWNADGSYRIQASGDELVTVEGVDESYKFVPFYITLDHEYKVQTEWKGTTEGTLTLDGTLENLFDGALFYTGGDGAQTGNFTLDKDDIEVSIDAEGNYNIFFWPNYIDADGVTENLVFNSIESFNAAAEAYSPEGPFNTNTIHDETEPGDFNVYFYGNISPNRTDYEYLYAYGNNFTMTIQQSGNDFVTVDGIAETEKFIPWYINLGKAYTVYNEWDLSKGTRRIRFTTDTLCKTLMFRDSNVNGFKVPGDGASPINVSADSLVQEEDGTYNVFIREYTSPTGTWEHEVIYGIDAFNAFLAGN